MYSLFFILLVSFTKSYAVRPGIFNRTVTQILEPLFLFIMLLHRVCWIVGSTFLIGACIRYLQYRRNAGESHLSQTIILGILGFVLLLLPIAMQKTRSIQYKFYIQQNLLKYY